MAISPGAFLSFTNDWVLLNLLSFLQYLSFMYSSIQNSNTTLFILYIFVITSRVVHLAWNSKLFLGTCKLNYLFPQPTFNCWLYDKIARNCLMCLANVYKLIIKYQNLSDLKRWNIYLNSSLFHSVVLFILSPGRLKGWIRLIDRH